MAARSLGRWRAATRNVDVTALGRLMPALRGIGVRTPRIVIVGLVGLAIVASATLQGDVPDLVSDGTNWVRFLLHR